MQPRPVESLTHVSTPPLPSESTNASQYGITSISLPSAGVHRSVEEQRLTSADPSNESSGFESATDGGQGHHGQLRRLSVDEDSGNRPKPSFQRISAYENALAPSPPRKQSEGPGFQIIKKKGNKAEGPQLELFPNEVLTHILSHLPAASLAAVSLVSRSFYSLVTTPHAWRIAFSRFFAGQDAIDFSALDDRRDPILESRESLRSEQRLFTRLTGLASWRSEYILRTRLLRSLGRGKPSQVALGHGASSRANSAANNLKAVVTYSSQLFATINRIHAVYNTGKKSPRFIHGTDETGSACSSDPNIGKVDNWGLADPQSLPQFEDLFVGHQPFGAGDGPAGLPNSMDVSQPYGMVHGEGFPGGQTYFRSSEEQRGRFLSQHNSITDHANGIPQITALAEAISSVWIAKSNAVPDRTDGVVGILTGSTLGVVTAYSLGADTPHGRRIPRGQLTAKWVLCPGVPIIAITADDNYTEKRKASSRVWAVALNALGEVFYLSERPTSGLFEEKPEEDDPHRQAWKTGRTAFWSLIEQSRRVAREDPFHQSEVHGSYSPRSSSRTMRLSKLQLAGETAEIGEYLTYRPAHFRKICLGWDMQRRLEVDFAGDDGKGAGEGIFIIARGIEDGENAEVKRFTRWNSEQACLEEYPLPKTPPPMAIKAPTMASLFGGGTVISPPRNSSPDVLDRTSLLGECNPISPARIGSPDFSPSTPGSNTAKESTDFVEEWRVSILSLKNHPDIVITTSAVDMSTYALLTADEDPLRTMNGSSALSTPFGTPSDQGSSESQIPGHRSRFLGVGTKTGSVILWNMRGPQSTNASLCNELQPLRTIYTDSPQISCLALSSLFIVHGGNDGLVQAWDPLASSLQPVRTLNSRFSSRARRRLVQAEDSIYGVGINLYAAGAISLDPDPTVLRGMVSLGTHLRYWSYSSSAADQYRTKKRRLRRSNERGNNGGSDRFTNTGRGALMDYIATEQEELKKEKLRRSKEEARLEARFGVGLGGLSEEEALKYAEMVSAEAFQKDEERRVSDAAYFGDEGSSSQSVWSTSSATITPEGSVKASASSSPPKFKTSSDFENDIEEAIRLSLIDGVDEGGRSPRTPGYGNFDVSIKYKPSKSFRSASSSSATSQASRTRKTAASVSSSSAAAEDLDFALKLSLAEEQSRLENTVDEQREYFPDLPDPEIKGKGKKRAQ